MDHEPPLAVLDQEDLLSQGIRTSKLVPGATDVDALGSCVFNATTAHLSTVIGVEAFRTVTGADGYSDTVRAEEYAIRLYHETTDLTGDPSSEWPPADCGSSGLFVCKELEAQRVIAGHKTAVGADNLVSLMQAGTVIVGQPWFQSWFNPDSEGFVDGDGTASALEASINSGVAGGHETCIAAVERLAFTTAGLVDPFGTVLRVRNSWASSWGDHGSYRIHASTYVMLGGYCDFRQMVA
ncbi:MAG TPA: hypothetical protein VFH54_07015 [Mycobacteriales bacterium]|nr:hypothetical protein [Mycobacteriales bacterium]